MNVSQLAEPDARRGGAQHRGRHHAALTAVMVCRISQDRTRIGPSVQQHPPRFSNITETEAWHDFRCRAEERKVLCTKPLRALRIPRRVVLRSGFHVPWGTCASPSPSHEEGVALLVARTCNEVVPTHKEFLRARQTPVPLICIALPCFDSTHAPVATAARAAGTGLVSMSTRPDIPGTLHLEREARDWSTYNEYSHRIILLLLLLYVYCSRVHPHFPSQFRRRRVERVRAVCARLGGKVAVEGLTDVLP